jgi:hypothetical protein
LPPYKDLRKDAEKIKVRKEEKVHAPSFVRSQSLHVSASLRKSFVRRQELCGITRPFGLGWQRIISIYRLLILKSGILDPPSSTLAPALSFQAAGAA